MDREPVTEQETEKDIEMDRELDREQDVEQVTEQETEKGTEQDTEKKYRTKYRAFEKNWTADTKRTHIEGGKTVADLHRDYVAECKSKGLPFGNYLAYYNIFCTEYNMAFFKPKKDQCETCTNYTNATEEDKQIMKHDYKLHLKEKQLARDQKDEDKNYTPDNCIVSAAMPCPKGDTSTFYYLYKLNCYNCTIYDIKTKYVNCYVLHEGEAKHGAIEIGTCVLKYIESLEETAKKLDSKLDLISYSDNCCGQQKNHYLIAVYIFAVHNYDFINSIL
ncbi:unnamed protein product [Parnassius apollo]|uniref:(apollo) hypothetical protein n=1 Tax=Parnassius apollo TaxID=110799 RepID=A0A8S3X238_PARAO|nr:unnamed protein product [Parnassius apollo]